jgi:hypothetical protein
VLNRKPLYYVLAAFLLVSLVPLQANIDRRRGEEKLVSPEQPSIRPGGAAIGLLLAGFRGVAANMLWFRAMLLFEGNRVTEEIPVFQAIAYLQPRFRSTWSFGAWHIAYNVSAHFYERKDLTDHQVDRYRFDCFKIGEEFLRRGIESNYYHYDLHWDLGFSILYYKQYKLIKEKGWPGEKEALQAAIEEMKIASLFQPPLATHPAFVERIIAVVMKEGGMLEDAYKMWYRLQHWPKKDENLNVVRKHMDPVVDRIRLQDAISYALELENDKKLAEAYRVWYYLLVESESKKAKLSAEKYPDAELLKEAEKDVESISKNTAKLEKALADQGADIKSLQDQSLKEGIPQALQGRIDSHLRSLEDQATKEHEADTEKTLSMYRELTRPAPKLDWWVFLFVPLLLLTGGYLMFGRETYAS